MGLVLSLQLLTMPGTWVTSDHAEMIFTARRLLTAGRFDFADAGQKVPVLPWLLAEPGKPAKPRAFPGTALALLPFVAADRALGLDAPPDLGALVHLEGPLFVALALLLIGLALRQAGASDRAVVVAVLMAGSSWPVWQISRRAGVEPLLAVLVAAFLLASVRKRFRIQAAIAYALPWCHPTGSLLAPLLALGEGLAPDESGGSRKGALRRVAWLLGVALLGTASVALLWNRWYHGRFGGGYAQYGVASEALHFPSYPIAAAYLGDSLLRVPLLLMLAVATAVHGGRRALRRLALPFGLLVAHLALFSMYRETFLIEPSRRLAVTWLALGFAIGATFDRLRLSAQTSSALALLSLLAGVYWYRLVEANYYAWADGSYEPLVWWITLAVAGRSSVLWAGPIVALGVFGAIAALRVSGVFAPATNGIRD